MWILGKLGILGILGFARDTWDIRFSADAGDSARFSRDTGDVGFSRYVGDTRSCWGYVGHWVFPGILVTQGFAGGGYWGY